MLDERKINAALMRAQGIDVIEIAKVIGISRATYYNWEKSEEFKAEVSRLGQEFLTQARNMAAYLAPKAMKKIAWYAENADSEKVALDANRILLDKTVPNMTKLTLDDGRDSKDNVPVDVLDAEMNDIDNE